MFSSSSMNLRDYFRKTDEGFIGLTKPQDEEFLYRASGVLVQSTWELPIVIQCPNSSVTYEFSSTPGDISFGVVFVAAPESQQNVDDLDIETVEEVERVPSGTDCVSGSFDVPAEGVIFFLWDNNFDWSSVKSISYSIRVFQPQFATLDDQRCTFALEHLSSTVEDLNLSLYRHADAQSALDHNSANVAFLEDRIAELEKKLSARKEAIAAVSTQITQSEKQIWMRRQCSSGLCIRMLNRHLMMCVISYLPYSQGASSVCKYWRELFKSQPSDRVTQAEKWYVGKMNKQERNRLLFEIQLSKKSNLSFSESRNNDKGGNTTTLVSSSHQHQYSSDTSGSGGRLGSEQRLVAPVVETAVKITYDHILPQTMSSSHKSASLTNSKPADVGRQHHRSTEKKTKGSASSRRRKSSRHDPGDTANLQYLQQIRSEQQIKSIVDYISDTMQKIDGLQNDRRRVKKLIKAWNTSHERKYGHAPSAQERKGHLRSLHEEYRQLELAIQVQQHKIDGILAKAGLTTQQYEQLRNGIAATY